MNTAKIYYNTAGDEMNIFQMIREEPGWTASRFQHMESKIESLEAQLSELKHKYQALTEKALDNWNDKKDAESKLSELREAANELITSHDQYQTAFLNASVDDVDKNLLGPYRLREKKALISIRALLSEKGTDS